MPFGEEEAKTAVLASLREVADFAGTAIEAFTFRRFNSFHRQVFLGALKVRVQRTPRDDGGYYDVLLNDDSLDEWPTVGDCIKWIARNRKLRAGDASVLSPDDLRV